MYLWSDQQLSYFEHVLAKNPDNSPVYPLIKVEATAGSSKSTSSVEAARRLKEANPHHTTRYLVFGTAAAAEAKLAFGYTATVSTLHALAYYYIVGPYKLNKNIAPFISWRDIPKEVTIPYNKTEEVIGLIDLFCASRYTSFSSFIANEHSNTHMNVELPAKRILDLMATGKMRCTHNFYLKLFHILLVSNQLQIDEVDTLFVDEVQDLTEITLDVVTHYPAKQKILVGDSAQSIFSWMGCVNAFTYYKNQGITLHLSKSFRVSSIYAKGIEAFLQRHHDPEAEFIGQDYTTQVIKSKVYLTRTNSAVIAKMAECSIKGIPYKLAHTAKIEQMFKLPIALLSIKPGDTQRDPELQHIQQDVNDWDKLNEETRPTKRAYILEQNRDNPGIVAANKLLAMYPPDLIFKLKSEAETHKKLACDLTITTAHAAKGGTWDEAELDPELDESIESFLDKPLELLDAEEQESFYLYFVAITRARYSVKGATYLTELLSTTKEQ